MKYKIDLHVHSKFSGDNDSDPEETVLVAIERGLHGIAFTEHYHYNASESVESLREKYRDRILIMRGVEFSTAEGHCLVFGADTDKLSLVSASVHDVIRAVHGIGGVVIASHPFRSVNSLGDSIWSVRGLCALEGFNGGNMHVFNVKAIKAAAQLNLPYTGGSDAHSSYEVGSCYTAFRDCVTEENFIDLLKGGDYLGVDTRKISRTIVNSFSP